MPGLLPIAGGDHPALAHLERDLDEVAIIFERQLASDLSAVNTLCLHVERYRGKMLRPLLVMTCGMASVGDDGTGGAVTPAHHALAAVVEMIHMATLVHDDVLDDADTRRQGQTVNARWGNETAVMLGDYLISNAFHLCSSIGDPSLNLALGEVTNTLCEGELVQLHHRDNDSLDEGTYLEIVRRKTASLIAAACRLGARLSRAPEEVCEALGAFGMSLGIAFQIQDDVLDLIGDPRVVGKSLGKDLEKGKLTLPLIHALERCDADGRMALIQAIQRRDAPIILERLDRVDAVASARRAAQDLVDEAKGRLPHLPESGVRDLLSMMADAVVMRAR